LFARLAPNSRDRLNPIVLIRKTTYVETPAHASRSKLAGGTETGGRCAGRENQFKIALGKYGCIRDCWGGETVISGAKSLNPSWWSVEIHGVEENIEGISAAGRNTARMKIPSGARKVVPTIEGR